jgi:hypothetical protein
MVEVTAREEPEFHPRDACQAYEIMKACAETYIIHHI